MAPSFPAPPRSCGQRHHYPTLDFYPKLHQFSLPARLVAQERPREYVPAGTNRYFLARRHQPLECSGELQGGECGAGALARRQFANLSRCHPEPAPRCHPAPPHVVIPSEARDLGLAAAEEHLRPQSLWLNAEHIRALPVEELSARLLPIVRAAGFDVTPEKMLRITPLIRERIKLLRDVLSAADFFFFVDQLPPYDPAD